MKGARLCLTEGLGNVAIHKKEMAGAVATQMTAGQVVTAGIVSSTRPSAQTSTTAPRSPTVIKGDAVPVLMSIRDPGAAAMWIFAGTE